MLNRFSQELGIQATQVGRASLHEVDHGWRDGSHEPDRIGQPRTADTGILAHMLGTRRASGPWPPASAEEWLITYKPESDGQNGRARGRSVRMLQNSDPAATVGEKKQQRTWRRNV